MSPRHLPGRRAVACALLTSLGLALAACGGEERSVGADATLATTTTVEFEQWQTSLDEACTALNTRFADLADAQPADAEEAVDYAADVDRFVRAIAAAADDGGVPDEHRGRVADLGSRLGQLAAATRQLSSAAVDGDPTRATTAAAKVHELAAEIDPVAVELGVPACGGF